MMNKKAQDLGLEHTHFITPHGLDQEEHYTTAHELAQMTQYALEKSEFREIVGTKAYTITINGYPKTLGNTNELLGYLNGVYGVKTGFTNKAGRCLVTSAKRGELDIICVVLGSDTKRIRTQDSIKLIEYAFKNYEIINIQEKIQNEFEDWKEKFSYTLIKAKDEKLQLQLSDLPYNQIPIKSTEKNHVEVEITCAKKIEAPIEKNQAIGSLTLKVGERPVVQLDIITKNEIKKKNIWDYFHVLWKNYHEVLLYSIV